MLTLELVTGGAAAIMQDFADHPEVRKIGQVRPQIALGIARSLMERKTIAYCENLIYQKLETEYNFFKLMRGEWSDDPTRAIEMEEWSDAADDMVAAIFEPYEKDVSASWLGVAVIDTRIYEEGAIQKLANGFAREVWKALTHDHEIVNIEIDGATRQRARGAMSAPEICGLIGLTAKDLTSLTEPVEPERTTVTQTYFTIPSIEMVIQKIWNNLPKNGTMVDENEIADAIETCADDDDGLALGGAKRLQIDMADVEAIRAEKKKVGPAIGAHIVEKLKAFDPDAATQEVMEMPENDPWAGLMGTMVQPAPGGWTPPPPPPPPPAAQAHSPPAAADPWAFLETAAPPPPPAADAPKKRGRKSAAEKAAEAAGDPNRMNPQILQFLKQAAFTDQDIANGLGVSRATANQYALGRSSLILNDGQKDFLRRSISEKMALLQSALQLISP